jgi:hypothetical protein
MAFHIADAMARPRHQKIGRFLNRENQQPVLSNFSKVWLPAGPPEAK